MLVIGKLTHLSACGQESFRRDTASIDAGATHVARFNDRRLQSMVGSMLCSIKASISGTDHNDVEVEAGVAHPNYCCVPTILALRRSKRRGTAAAATFNDSTLELCGRVTAWVQQA